LTIEAGIDAHAATLRHGHRITPNKEQRDLPHWSARTTHAQCR